MARALALDHKKEVTTESTRVALLAARWVTTKEMDDIVAMVEQWADLMDGRTVWMLVACAVADLAPTSDGRQGVTMDS